MFDLSFREITQDDSGRIKYIQENQVIVISQKMIFHNLSILMMLAYYFCIF